MRLEDTVAHYIDLYSNLLKKTGLINEKNQF
jgi:hypothetical protein